MGAFGPSEPNLTRNLTLIRCVAFIGSFSSNPNPNPNPNPIPNPNLVRCVAFIGSFSSNVAILVHDLMLARRAAQVS